MRVESSSLFGTVGLVQFSHILPLFSVSGSSQNFLKFHVRKITENKLLVGHLLPLSFASRLGGRLPEAKFPTGWLSLRMQSPTNSRWRLCRILKDFPFLRRFFSMDFLSLNVRPSAKMRERNKTGFKTDFHETNCSANSPRN